MFGVFVIFLVNVAGNSNSAVFPSFANYAGLFLLVAGLVVAVAMARKTSTALWWIAGSLALAALMKAAQGLVMFAQCIDCYLSDSPPPAPPADAFALTLGSVAKAFLVMAPVFAIVAVTHPVIQRFFSSSDTHESDVSDQMVEGARFCGQCGSAITAADSFCDRCGHSLRPTND